MYMYTEALCNYAIWLHALVYIFAYGYIEDNNRQMNNMYLLFCSLMVTNVLLY